MRRLDVAFGERFVNAAVRTDDATRRKAVTRSADTDEEKEKAVTRGADTDEEKEKAVTSHRNPKVHWPHGPSHWLFEPGIYMVTASTYQKAHHLSDPTVKDFFQQALFDISRECNWHLHAWAILSNHYHFIAFTPENPNSLIRLIRKLHMTTAKEINRRDRKPGRKVWFQYWDTKITYQKSYLARLNYVNNNPVKHGLVGNPENYPWCSGAWFSRNAPASFVETVKRFKIDRVRVFDKF